MNKSPEEIPSLNKRIAEINKKYGAGTIGYLGKMDMQTERVSTGIPALDKAFGETRDEKGNVTSVGMPLGRLVELFGIPSSGKSLISLKTIAEAQRKGLNCV